ncbi:hypothetical protein MASR1M12_03650 [Erysipelotrichia bacterium]
MYPFRNLSLKLRSLQMLLPRRDFITATAVWLVISALLVIFNSLTTPFDNRLKDLKIRFNASYVKATIPADILLLSIDSETLATAPHKWPWPQSYWAKLLRRINDEGQPKALIIDVYFQTPESDDDTELKVFAETIGDTGRTGLVALYEEVVTNFGRQLKFVPPHKLLRRNAAFSGLSQQPIDEDGKIRSFRRATCASTAVTAPGNSSTKSACRSPIKMNSCAATKRSPCSISRLPKAGFRS